MVFTLLLSVAISQICPASEDLDSFEKYWSVILFKATQSGFFWFCFFFSLIVRLGLWVIGKISLYHIKGICYQNNL